MFRKEPVRATAACEMDRPRLLRELSFRGFCRRAFSSCSAGGDYSISWGIVRIVRCPGRRVWRWNEEKMQPLMMDVVDRTCRLIHRLWDEADGGVILFSLAERDCALHWQAPRCGASNY